jgi:hypothetical protein
MNTFEDKKDDILSTPSREGGTTSLNEAILNSVIVYCTYHSTKYKVVGRDFALSRVSFLKQKGNQSTSAMHDDGAAN